jgi:hypothetical protein
MDGKAKFIFPILAPGIVAILERNKVERTVARA